MSTDLHLGITNLFKSSIQVLRELAAGSLPRASLNQEDQQVRSEAALKICYYAEKRNPGNHQEAILESQFVETRN